MHFAIHSSHAERSMFSSTEDPNRLRNYLDTDGDRNNAGSEER